MVIFLKAKISFPRLNYNVLERCKRNIYRNITNKFCINVFAVKNTIQYLPHKQLLTIIGFYIKIQGKRGLNRTLFTKLFFISTILNQMSPSAHRIRYHFPYNAKRCQVLITLLSVLHGTFSLIYHIHFFHSILLSTGQNHNNTCVF